MIPWIHFKCLDTIIQSSYLKKIQKNVNIL